MGFLSGLFERFEEHGPHVLEGALEHHGKSGDEAHLPTSIFVGAARHFGRRGAEHFGSQLRGAAEHPHWFRALFAAAFIGAAIAAVDHWAENHLAPAVRQRFASRAPAPAAAHA